MKVTAVIYMWLEERDEDYITSKFGIGPGDIYRYVQLYNWLLYSLHEIATLYKRTTLKNFVKKIQLRIKYGVKQELLELVSLKGIGRVKARILYNHGYNSIKSLKNAKYQDLLKLEYIGPEIIKSIFNQIGVLRDESIPNSIQKKSKSDQKIIDEYF